MSKSIHVEAAEEDLRQVERGRLRSLVDGDVAAARRLHADDFQLINPFGGSLSKEEYLGAIEAGDLKYLVWEPEEIEVRTYGNAAAMRYRARLENVFRGQKRSLRQYWHTDLYERRNGQWQVVWSHATEIQGSDRGSL